MRPGDSVPSLGAHHLPGVLEPARGSFAARWDPGGGAVADLGDIGEDDRGVWARRHPEILLAEDRALRRMINRYRRTGIIEITAEDDRILSGWELAALGIIIQAHHRAVRARAEAPHAS